MKFNGIVKAFFGAPTAVPFKSTGAGREVKIMGKHPVIKVEPMALATMYRYVDQCDTEVGWLGTAIMENDTITIGQVFLFEQQVSAVTTRISAEGLHKVAEQLIAFGEEGEKTLENLRFWGHSHVHMSTSPSGQDDQQMEEFGQNESPFFVRGIFNKEGSVRFDVYDYARKVIFVDCRWVVLADDSDDIFCQIDEEIRTKVKSMAKGHSSSMGNILYQGGSRGRGGRNS